MSINENPPQLVHLKTPQDVVSETVGSILLHETDTTSFVYYQRSLSSYNEFY
ncbi:MAG: hypothetical protein RIS47_848, partial [Bacteroidota bacterium]